MLNRREITGMLVLKAVSDPESVCAFVSANEKRRRQARKEIIAEVKENYKDLIVWSTVDELRLKNGSRILFINGSTADKLKGLRFNSFIVDELVSQETYDELASRGVCDE